MSGVSVLCCVLFVHNSWSDSTDDEDKWPYCTGVKLLCFCVSQTDFCVLQVHSVIAARDHYDTHTVGRTPLDEWSPRRRDLYLTTHNIDKRQTSIPRGGFEPEFPASERRQTCALDHVSVGIGFLLTLWRHSERNFGWYVVIGSEYQDERETPGSVPSYVFGEHEGRCQIMTFSSTLSRTAFCNLLRLSVFVADMSVSLEELSIPFLFRFIPWYLFTLANCSSSVLGA